MKFTIFVAKVVFSQITLSGGAPVVGPYSRTENGLGRRYSQLIKMMKFYNPEFDQRKSAKYSICLWYPEFILFLLTWAKISCLNKMFQS